MKSVEPITILGYRVTCDCGRVWTSLSDGEQAPQTQAQPVLGTPEAAAQYLLPLYSQRPTETFGVLSLNTRHRLIRDAVISTGALDATLVHPREVFFEALSNRAAAVVLFHNHPSGDPEPSYEDIHLTRRLVQAGAVLGIAVLDHVILGAGRYVSLKNRGAV